MNIDEKLSPTFCKMVDDLVLYANWADNELAEAIKWLDEIAVRENVSFYNKVYDVLYKNDINKKAKEWLNTK